MLMNVDEQYTRRAVVSVDALAWIHIRRIRWGVKYLPSYSLLWAIGVLARICLIGELVGP